MSLKRNWKAPRKTAEIIVFTQNYLNDTIVILIYWYNAISFNFLCVVLRLWTSVLSTMIFHHELPWFLRYYIVNQTYYVEILQYSELSWRFHLGTKYYFLLIFHYLRELCTPHSLTINYLVKGNPFLVSKVKKPCSMYTVQCSFGFALIIYFRKFHIVKYIELAL